MCSTHKDRAGCLGMGCTMTLSKLPPRNWGMHLFSNVSANAEKHTVIGMRIIVELLLSKKNYCWVPLTSTLVFCLGKTLVSFITGRHSAAVCVARETVLVVVVTCFLLQKLYIRLMFHDISWKNFIRNRYF